MTKKKQPKKSLLGSPKKLLGGPPSDARYAKSFAKSRKRAKSRGPRRDLLAPFQLPILDLDLLVHLGKRLYRVNEELAFRPQHISKLELRALEALEAEWKIHPYFKEGADEEEELPDAMLYEDEDDLEDLPFDTSART